MRSPTPRVERRLTLPATLDDVWAELTDPVALSDWLGASGMEMLDGRQVRLLLDGVPHEAVVEVVAERRRLAWRWWPVDEDGGSKGVSSVDIRIHACGQDTELHLVEAPSSRPVGFRVHHRHGS
jgi:uncharacterized protein YndB with AHSA1/START domain